MKIYERHEWGARYPDGGGYAPIPAKEVWLHHSVTMAPANNLASEFRAIQTIELIGQQRFGQGISYSFCIVPSGRVFRGHSINRMGAHTGGRNSIARAICYVGNYQVTDPTEAMIDSTVELLLFGYEQKWWIRKTLNGGHRDLKSTSCPGDRAYNLIPTINHRASTGDIMARLDQEDYDNIAKAVWNYNLGATKGGLERDPVSIPSESARDRINAIRRAGFSVRDRLFDLLSPTKNGE